MIRTSFEARRLPARAALAALIAFAIAAEPDPAAWVAGDGVISAARAIVGRPATPGSVAGVARRSTRRVVRRSTVYVAALPRGCSTVSVNGALLHQCGATYYQPYGTQYVVVHVD